jgi:hypothetical protein
MLRDFYVATLGAAIALFFDALGDGRPGFAACYAVAAAMLLLGVWRKSTPST